jgi:hypothetical protein
MIIEPTYGAIYQQQNYFFPIWNYSGISPVVEPALEPFIIGRGKLEMRIDTVFNFDYPMKILPIISINQWSTAFGKIIVKDEFLSEVTTLTGSVYACVPPTVSASNWVGSGSDLYTSNILDLDSRKLSTGNIQILYRFDPSPISGIDDGQYYFVLLKLNDADDASIAHHAIEIIMKVDDKVTVP